MPALSSLPYAIPAALHRMRSSAFVAVSRDAVVIAGSPIDAARSGGQPSVIRWRGLGSVYRPALTGDGVMENQLAGHIARRAHRVTGSVPSADACTSERT